MPFTFNAVKLCVVTIKEKPWTRAKEVCRALEHKKGRSADVLKKHVSIENKQHKHELEGCVTAGHPLKWPKNSQPDDYYINEEGMYQLLFSSQQQRENEFRRHCCNVMFPRIRQRLSDKLHEMEIEDLTNRTQALEFTNEEERQPHQHKILRLNEEINDLITNRHVAHRGYFDNLLCFIKEKSGEFHPYYVI